MGDGATSSRNLLHRTDVGHDQGPEDSRPLINSRFGPNGGAITDNNMRLPPVKTKTQISFEGQLLNDPDSPLDFPMLSPKAARQSHRPGFAGFKGATLRKKSNAQGGVNVIPRQNVKKRLTNF